jgi:ABC-type Zn2+ transport system substrate-binding protein/surface adhesin
VRSWRKIVGVAMAALYALFVAMPAAVVAAAPSGTAPPCLSEMLGAPHDHHLASRHHDHDHGAAHSGTTPHHHDHSQSCCCGLFGTSVLLPSRIEGVLIATRAFVRLVASVQPGLHGHSPPRLDRPPRQLPSV